MNRHEISKKTRKMGLPKADEKNRGDECPICDGNLDGHSWSSGDTKKSHTERCTGCTSLIHIKKGKIDGDYSEDRVKYEFWSGKYEQRKVTAKNKIRKLKKKEKTTWHKFKMFFTTYTTEIQDEIERINFAIHRETFSRSHSLAFYKENEKQRLKSNEEQWEDWNR